VTISFDAWKEGQVAPSTHEIRVVPPKPGSDSEPVSRRLVKTLVYADRRADVDNVRFAADGSRLFVVGDPSGVVQVIELATGKEVRRLTMPPGYHRGTAEYAVPTPDFRTLYVPIERHKGVAFEKDGQKHYRSEYQGEVLVWDLATGKELPSLPTSSPGRGVPAAYLAPTGDKLVTEERASTAGGEDWTIETVLWDLPTRTAKVLGGAGLTAFSRDGRRLAVARSPRRKEPSGLVVWDVATGRPLLTLKPTVEGRFFWWPAFSPDGKTLATQDATGRPNQPATLRFYDVETGKELASFDSTGDYPFLFPTFSPDGRRLALVDYAEHLTIWEVAARQVERRTGLAGLKTVGRITFSPDGSRLAVPAMRAQELAAARNPDPADRPQPRLLLFDLARAGEPEVLVCPHGYCSGPVFSPDGKLLAVGGSGGVHLFDLSRK
jgi:WD40 repeat protein